MIDYPDDESEPSFDRPVSLSYSYFDLTLMDTNLTKVQFETRTALHQQPEANMNILIIKDGYKLEYYQILGPSDPNPEYALNQINANQDNGYDVSDSVNPPFKVVNT